MLPFNDYLLKKTQRKEVFDFFYGQVHKLGHAAASVRNTKQKPHFTAICVHGFLADHRYFNPIYPEFEVELILFTCSGYHVPVAQSHFDTPAWSRPIPYKQYTLEYDGAALCQALENLPTTDNIRVHGHSRGGAVILEACRQRPDLFADVEVVLEAPILPKTKRSSLTKVWAKKPLLWMAPYYGQLLKPVGNVMNTGPIFGKLSNEMVKFLMTMLSAPKTFQTVVNNVESFERWSKTHGYDIYENLTRGYICIPEKDRVLDRTTMLESAKHAEPQMEVIETPASSHFLALEDRRWIPRMRKKAAKSELAA